ncbi:MAG: tripartite tricarboxylate transporter substrate binding protein [Burkholderiaceae bacterium]
MKLVRTSPSLDRRDCLRLIVGAGALGIGGGAGAQSYPSKTITLIVPYPAGGVADVVGRTLAENLGKTLGQTMIVDNRAGASGVIGISAMTKAPADGHTLAIGINSSLMFNRFLFKKLPYDPDKDVALVARIATIASVLVVHPSVPADNLGDLVRYLQANKGKTSYGSYGPGTGPHLYGSHLSRLYDAELVHVPYKGEQPMVQDLLGGQIKLTFCAPQSAKVHGEAGKLKCIAVCGDQRFPTLPQVPTFGEQGVRDAVFRSTGWLALAAPAATPKEVVRRLAEETQAAIALPAVSERLAASGVNPAFLGPDEFTAAYKAELPVWENVVKQSGVTLE